MSEAVYSFVFDRQKALLTYPKTGKYDLVLGILASIQPETGWEGCIVYDGISPMEEPKTACIGVRGAAADRVQESLVEGFERKGVRILQVYEGGPEIRELFAKVENGTWVATKQ
jgi:hypothetical protein